MPTTPNPPKSGARRRPKVSTLAAAAAGIGVLAMWAWVFAYHLGGSWQEARPGQLTDTGFAVAAEPRCAIAMADLGALPPAWETTDPDMRAATVDDSVTILQAMVDDLAALPAGQDQQRVDEWVSDWRTYVNDRAEYAERLRREPDTRFYVTQSDRDRRQITLAIDRLAETNGMPSCATPGDLT